MYIGTEFEHILSQFLTTEETPDIEVSFRGAVFRVSLGGHRQFCNCTSGCHSNRCKCRSANSKCNSKCHKNRACHNVSYHCENLDLLNLRV